MKCQCQDSKLGHEPGKCGIGADAPIGLPTCKILENGRGKGRPKVSFKTHPTRDVIKASAFNVLRRRGVQEKDLEAEYQRLLNSRTSISPIKVRARQWPG
jgi:hypothetical protein